jgi:hypothetical protein
MRFLLAALLLGATASPVLAQNGPAHGDPHRPGGAGGKPSLGTPRPRSGLPTSIGVPRPSISNEPAIGRNAIGASVTPPDGSRRTGVEVLGHPPPQAPPLSPSLRIGNPSIGRPAGPPTNTLRGGGINGSSVTRPGVTPSVLGGPAKPMTGINGTSFRHK